MYRLRLLVLAFVVVLGASLARGQDGTNPFDKTADQNSAQEKAKSKQEKTKSNDNHRRHWYSPPHWFHKKHDTGTSTSQAGKNSDGKTGAVTGSTTKNSDNKTATNQ